MMNKQQLINTIEAIRKDAQNWNTLKLREVEQGIITQEQYEEMQKVSDFRVNMQIARIENEIAAL